MSGEVVLDEVAIHRLADAVLAPGNVLRYAAAQGLTADEATQTLAGRVQALLFTPHPFAYGDIARYLTAMLVPQAA